MADDGVFCILHFAFCTLVFRHQSSVIGHPSSVQSGKITPSQQRERAMAYLTDKKVAVMGAAGAIGSNMVQDLLSTGTANNIAMYDPFGAGLEGAAEEIYHCAFQGANVTWTTHEAETPRGASYILFS